MLVLMRGLSSSNSRSAARALLSPHTPPRIPPFPRDVAVTAKHFTLTFFGRLTNNECIHAVLYTALYTSLSRAELKGFRFGASVAILGASLDSQIRKWILCGMVSYLSPSRQFVFWVLGHDGNMLLWHRFGLLLGFNWMVGIMHVCVSSTSYLHVPHCYFFSTGCWFRLLAPFCFTL